MVAHCVLGVYPSDTDCSRLILSYSTIAATAMEYIKGGRQDSLDLKFESAYAGHARLDSKVGSVASMVFAQPMLILAWLANNVGEYICCLRRC